jgi:ribosomal protein S12 methylthiotransferase RimO
MRKTLHLVSLGCTKNLIDSEVMLGKLSEYEVIEDPSLADLIIVNSCGFIEAAKEESINTVLTLHQNRKEDSLLVMSGCLSERYKEALMSELKEVDIFTGVGDYDKIDELVRERKSRFSPRKYLIKDESRVITNSNYHAYIKLSEGCNQRCSFCAIPSFKGKLQSRSLRDIVDEVKALVELGFYDFSFISQDSSSYLRDFDIRDGLSYLIDEIETIDGVKSARILYLYPSTLSLEVIGKIMSSKKFHNYFDMPIQHISNEMLKVMKRGVGSEFIRSQLSLMKTSKESFIRTAVIAGHPRESEEDFKELCLFLEEFGFDRVSVFAYSDEEGTDSFNMSEKIGRDIIRKRVEILEEIVKKTTDNSLEKEVGRDTLLSVEGESSEGEFFVGAKKLLWAKDIDGEILINENESSEKLEVGRCYEAKITQKVGESLIATVKKLAW